MITVNALQKNDAFKDISFELESGVLAVLSKKAERSSLLLDALAGFKKADCGSLSGNENVAYIAKGAPLPKTLTAEEYLKFVVSVKGISKIPENVLTLVEDFFDAEIGRISSVERMTLGVAGALIGKPDVIILEAPYFGLYYEEYGDLRELLRLVSEDVPVIFSSSSVFECKEISDKILVMSSGTQIYFGETEELFKTDINETDICCFVKGEIESIVASLGRYSPDVEETSREGIFSVTVKSVPMFKAAEVRSKIKKILSKARLPLLEMKSEKEALLNIIGELTENDRKKREEYEETRPSEITKITGSLISFSHDGDEDYDDEEYDPEE